MSGMVYWFYSPQLNSFLIYGWCNDGITEVISKLHKPSVLLAIDANFENVPGPIG